LRRASADSENQAAALKTRHGGQAAALHLNLEAAMAIDVTRHYRVWVGIKAK